MLLSIRALTSVAKFYARRDYTHTHTNRGTHARDILHKAVASRRLCVLLSCVRFANLPFMRAIIFQTPMLIVRRIVHHHWSATKGRDRFGRLCKSETWINHPTHWLTYPHLPRLYFKHQRCTWCKLGGISQSLCSRCADGGMRTWLYSTLLHRRV